MQINITCFNAWIFFFNVRIAAIQNIVARLHFAFAVLLLQMFLYILHTARKIIYLLIAKNYFFINRLVDLRNI